MAATNRSLEEILNYDALTRAFLVHSVQHFWQERMKDFGKLLGTHFTAGEVRAWANKGGGPGVLRDEDPIYMPLSLTIKPELREGLMKMVGGMPLPKEFKKGTNEIVVDLGQVSREEFIEFIQQHRDPAATPRPPGTD